MKSTASVLSEIKAVVEAGTPHAHNDVSTDYYISPSDRQWTPANVVNAIIGATTQHHDVDPIRAIRYLLSGLSREQLIQLYNNRCGMETEKIIAAIAAV